MISSKEWILVIIGFILFVTFSQSNTLRIRRLGRFGNNVVQIRNAITMALQHGIPRIIHQSHDIIFDVPKKKPCTMSFIHLLMINMGILRLFGLSILYGFMYPSFDYNLRDSIKVSNLVREYYKQVFNFKYEPHNRNDLVIHVRSGDIFIHKGKHIKGHGQPPYDYYKTIIESGNWDRVIVVAQDELNPIIKKLKNEFNAEFKLNDLKTDIEQILNANTIVAGNGTFVPGILSLSLGKKKVFYFNYCKIYRCDLEDGRVQHKTKPINVKGYIKNWRNTPHQHDIMVNFDLAKGCNMSQFKEIIH